VRVWPGGRRGSAIGQIQGLAVMVNRQSLKLTFRLSRLVANPLESPCGNQADNQQVVSAETRRVLPGVSFLVGSLEGDVEHGTFLRLLTPDARAHGAVADFMDRLTV
jgi:hypothetical protein